MTAVDYTRLFEPIVRLRLIPVPGGYTVRDQNGQAYVLAPATFSFCARFMRAMQEKKDARIDEDSVLRWYRHERWIAAKSSGEGPNGQPTRAPAGHSVPVPASVAAHETPPSPDEFSVRIPSNVYPLWKDSA